MLRRATLDATPPVDGPSSLDQHGALLQPAFADAAVQSGAAIGTDATFDLMSGGAVFGGRFHRPKSAAHR
ncbi:MAG TPA: hypothetical protein VIV83_04190 [Gemmatimonadales bacterium]